MQAPEIIKAMDAYAVETGLSVETIGQYAVSNRHAYDRLKKGSAQVSTGQRIMDWIEADRMKRKAGDAA